MRKEQQEAKEHNEAERLRREQNFSVCFSGANSRKTPTARNRRSSSGGAFGQERLGAGCWRQWEEHTVEIQGSGGEVFALRPSGERQTRRLDGRAPSGECKGGPRGSPCGGSSGSSFGLGRRVRAISEDCPWDEPACGPEAPPASSPQSATQRELRALLAELEESPKAQQAAPISDAGVQARHGSGLEVDVQAGDDGILEAIGSFRLSEAGESQALKSVGEARPTSSCGFPAGGGEVGPAGPATPTSSQVLAEAEEALRCSPAPQELAERIARLPQMWQERLLQLLQEAEASSGLESSTCQSRHSFSRSRGIPASE